MTVTNVKTRSRTTNERRELLLRIAFTLLLCFMKCRYCQFGKRANPIAGRCKRKGDVRLLSLTPEGNKSGNEVSTESGSDRVPFATSPLELEQLTQRFFH